MKKIIAKGLMTLAVLGLFGAVGMRMEAANMTAQDLQRMFPNGAYWNHMVAQGHEEGLAGSRVFHNGSCNNTNGYTWHACTDHYDYEKFHYQKPGSYECNVINGVIQCRGFVSKLTKLVYNTFPDSWEKKEDTLEGVKPGDVILYYSFYDAESLQFGHQAMILDVNGSKLCLGECNLYDACQISWGRWMDVRDVDKYTIFSAPSQLQGAGEDNIFYGRKGDVNGDEKRDLADAQRILRGALRIDSIQGDEFWAADVDGDGKIGLEDAQFLLKVALKIEEMGDEELYEWIQWERESMEKEEKANQLREQYETEFPGRWGVDADQDGFITETDSSFMMFVATNPDLFEDSEMIEYYKAIGMIDILEYRKVVDEIAREYAELIQYYDGLGGMY